jgi:hypothetical protein
VFTCEVGAVVWFGFGPEGSGVDGTVPSLHGQDFGASRFHVVLDEWSDLHRSVAVRDEDVGLWSCVSAIKDPTHSWVDSWLLSLWHGGLSFFLFSNVDGFDVATKL